MLATLNALVLLSIATLIGGCGGGGDGDGNDAAVSSSPVMTDPVGQTSPSSAPASGKDQAEQRAN